jgi:uncharacterized protein YqjF (DUF2071 family)
MKRPFLSAEWRHLAMLNYEVDPAILRPLVPFGTELDAWNGKTFLSLVGFRFLRTRVFGIPIPFHRNFDEVNLRFYVRRKAGAEWRRGVTFVKEIVPRAAIAWVARCLYNENYVACRVVSQVRLPGPGAEGRGAVEYRWEYASASNAIRAEFEGEPACPAGGSEEEFITEHYWGYVGQRGGGALEYAVEHPRWRVWRASSAELECEVEVCYGPQFCEALGQRPSSAFVAEGSAVTVFRGEVLPATVTVASTPVR